MRLVANSMLAYSGMKIELMKSDVVGFGSGIVVQIRSTFCTVNFT